MHNNKRMTELKKSDSYAVVSFERGFENKKRRTGFGSLHIQKHLPDGSVGEISHREAVMMVDMLKDESVKMSIDEDGKRVYEKPLQDGNNLYLVIGDKKKGERVITMYSDRNLKTGDATNSAVGSNSSNQSSDSDSITPKSEVNTLKQELAKSKDAQRLMSSGKVEVVQSVDDLPAEISEQVKRSVAPTYDDYAELANVFLNYAESDGATQFKSSGSKSIDEITNAVSDGSVSVVDNGGIVHFYKDGKKVASLLDNNDGTIEINTAPLSADGSGKMIMHIALEYAFNNGFKLKPNGGLTKINTFRFTESMLSSALRHGTTKHLMPDVSAQKLTGWQSANDNERLLLLLQRSYENTIENTPSLPDASYDLRTARFMDNGGIVLTDKKEPVNLFV